MRIINFLFASTDKTRISGETRELVRQRLAECAQADKQAIFEKFGTSELGLSESAAEQSKENYGENLITKGRKDSLFKRIFEAFVNPFTAILIVLALVSVVTDITMAESGKGDPMTVIIIATMVIVSGVLRFVQETRSGDAAENLLKLITTTTCVLREETGKAEIPLDEVVVGDIVQLSAGDMIPADMRIIRAKDLFISQSALSGESVAVEKTAAPAVGSYSLTEFPNLAFMGTDVVSGSATGVVVAVGDDTVFGEMAKTVNEKPVETGFEKGVNSVSWLLIRIMLIMVPIVFIINGLSGDWLEAALFAISVAVGLTPEMLPMIVTTCLAKGAVAMSEKKTIIKNLNSIQNLGSMDILCTDKTGTLTRDKVVLQYHLNIHAKEDLRVLRHAFLNSYHQTGLKNLMDIAIIDRTKLETEKDRSLESLTRDYTKSDEIPFDFDRRRMSVVVMNEHKTQMITKGAVEEMLSICEFAEYEGEIRELTDDIKKYILERVSELNDMGMRVIAVAQKTNPSPVGAFSVADEAGMVLMGYLAFLDPPKKSAADAIARLNAHGVAVKVLTGDNDRVTNYICRQVGIPSDEIILGSQVDEMDDTLLGITAERVSVFAKLSPAQKARIITVLRERGHSVGYMGDGINDAAGMKASDVGISVDTAVDIAKESADVILLEKDLTVLEQGILEGRKTYANMIKYIKMTAASNFGNVFSVLVASIALPFLPMLSLQLILLNLIYDLSCIAVPWDNVDAEYLTVPRNWSADSIGKFMIWFGPTTSSIFDITTYLIMYFVICPAVTGGVGYRDIVDPVIQERFIAVFRAGWFVESMWTQTLVIHMLRTQKISFVNSRASKPVTVLTFAGIALLTVIPFTPFGVSIGLAPLPISFFVMLGITVVLYMGLVTLLKNRYVKKYGELL